MYNVTGDLFEGAAVAGAVAVVAETVVVVGDVDMGTGEAAGAEVIGMRLGA